MRTADYLAMLEHRRRDEGTIDATFQRGVSEFEHHYGPFLAVTVIGESENEWTVEGVRERDGGRGQVPLRAVIMKPPRVGRYGRA